MLILFIFAKVEIYYFITNVWIALLIQCIVCLVQRIGFIYVQKPKLKNKSPLILLSAVYKYIPMYNFCPHDIEGKRTKHLGSQIKNQLLAVSFVYILFRQLFGLGTLVKI